MKNFTKHWIKKWQPCEEAVDWFYEQKERGVIPVLEKLVSEERYDWANWAIVRCMKRQQYLRYAIYAAKSVLDIFEKKYPDDKRPRKAILAAQKCLEEDSKKNRDAATHAARVAEAVAYAATHAATYAAAYAAAYAAYAAARAAYATSATSAADAAAYATDKISLQIKILKYGIKLLKRGNQ